METKTNDADQNTERLLEKCYQTEAVPPQFATDMEKLLSATAQSMAQQQTTTPAPRQRWRWAALVVGSVAACALIAYALSNLAQTPIDPDLPQKKQDAPIAKKDAP